MKLSEAQSLFQQSVLGEAPSPDFLRQLNPPVRAEKIEDTFAVYHDGFRLRMAEFLGNDYPALHASLGDEAFETIALAYMSARPSRFRNARWFGAGLPDFLRATAPFPKTGSLAAWRRWRRRWRRVSTRPTRRRWAWKFSASPRKRIGRACISPLLPASCWWRRPPSRWPVTRRSSAAKKIPTFPRSRTKTLTLLVWREKLDVQYRSLDELEALALREALGGAPFGEICALLAFARPEEAAEQLTAAAAGFLAGWFSGGLIVAAAPKAE